MDLVSQMFGKCKKGLRMTLLFKAKKKRRLLGEKLCMP